LRGEVKPKEYGILVFPGGFSFGDDIASGKVLANRLVFRLRKNWRFLITGRPIIGICNGFQVLVKAGFLPGMDSVWDGNPTVTLTDNDSGRFECRWVHLKTSSKKVFGPRVARRVSASRGPRGRKVCPSDKRYF
jgi:phosphoribosylformylglycinamidine (FGAM) synthase-like amidotransferase family enzyme